MVLRTVRNVVDALGGLKATAKLCDVDYRSVSRWQVQDQCPARYFVIMTAALAKHGHCAPERLWKWRIGGGVKAICQKSSETEAAE